MVKSCASHLNISIEVKVPSMVGLSVSEQSSINHLLVHISMTPSIGTHHKDTMHASKISLLVLDHYGEIHHYNV